MTIANFRFPADLDVNAKSLADHHGVAVAGLIAEQVGGPRRKRIQVWAACDGRAVVVRWDAKHIATWLTTYNESLGRPFSAKDFAEFNRIPLIEKA